jgi:putative zinc finger/helix-turn-helix YgiT family protein
MKPFPWKCGNCRERAVNPATLPTYSADLEHDGRKYHVMLTDMQVAKCDNCGTIMLDDVASRRLSDALRNAAGLLHPAEIRANREALKLTQKTLAGYLFIAEATLSRWETGAQIQQRTMDLFLRTFFEVPEARRFLGVPEATPAVAQGESGLPPDLERLLHDFTQPANLTGGEQPSITPSILPPDVINSKKTPSLRLVA